MCDMTLTVCFCMPHLHSNIEVRCDREQLNLVFECLLCTVWLIEDSCAVWAVSHDRAQNWLEKEINGLDVVETCLLCPWPL